MIFFILGALFGWCFRWTFPGGDDSRHEMEIEAVRAGVGEWYLGEDNERAFRFIKPTNPE
jgi:hypothetical protein